MAIGINYVTVVGNLTRDPELRFTPSGTPVASFGVAVNKSFQNKSTGEWENDVDFFNVVAWFKLAENCAESLIKGDRVLITGRLSQDSWEDKDGQKRSVFKIIANVIAPSLEFATCKLEKNPRIDTQEGSQQGGRMKQADQGSSENQKNIEDDFDFSNDDIPF